jgi:hypothetical protein
LTDSSASPSRRFPSGIVRMPATRPRLALQRSSPFVARPVLANPSALGYKSRVPMPPFPSPSSRRHGTPSPLAASRRRCQRDAGEQRLPLDVW